MLLVIQYSYFGMLVINEFCNLINLCLLLIPTVRLRYFYLVFFSIQACLCLLYILNLGLIVFLAEFYGLCRQLLLLVVIHGDCFATQFAGIHGCCRAVSDFGVPFYYQLFSWFKLVFLGLDFVRCTLIIGKIHSLVFYSLFVDFIKICSVMGCLPH